MARRTARRPAAAPPPTAGCPCGTGRPYGDCCGRLHSGAAGAASAEQLMRSRYSAFAVQDAGYLLRTWSAATRPRELRLDADVRWTGLDILATTGGTAFHTDGTVEFRAHFTHDGRPGEQHENSRFTREDGQWVYVSEAEATPR
ncbi:YchJ family protein [Streptomyces sp. CA-111067]|uniref:YchJ family protein n=1 Tax=Streptomyces sp. CA-111067 TaxID=3240046 RepID=UPI003D962AB9